MQTYIVARTMDECFTSLFLHDAVRHVAHETGHGLAEMARPGDPVSQRFTLAVAAVVCYNRCVLGNQPGATDIVRGLIGSVKPRNRAEILFHPQPSVREAKQVQLKRDEKNFRKCLDSRRAWQCDWMRIAKDGDGSWKDRIWHSRSADNIRCLVFRTGKVVREGVQTKVKL